MSSTSSVTVVVMVVFLFTGLAIHADGSPDMIGSFRYNP